MKASVPAAGVHTHRDTRGRQRDDGDGSRFADFVTLTKPRLNLLVLLTTLAGLYLASPAGASSRCC